MHTFLKRWYYGWFLCPYNYFQYFSVIAHSTLEARKLLLFFNLIFLNDILDLECNHQISENKLHLCFFFFLLNIAHVSESCYSCIVEEALSSELRKRSRGWEASVSFRRMVSSNSWARRGDIVHTLWQRKTADKKL